MVVSPRDVCSREVMLAAPRLRAVISTVIGVDTIDMDAANDMGLIVGHGAMPENYLGVSEATVMLIAALLLDLPGKSNLLRTNARAWCVARRLVSSAWAAPPVVWLSVWPVGMCGSSPTTPTSLRMQHRLG